MERALSPPSGDKTVRHQVLGLARGEERWHAEGSSSTKSEAEEGAVGT